MSPGERLPVAVLGATGAVGQRLVSLLEGHPWFELREVVASPESRGCRYEEATAWLAPTALPAEAASLPLRTLEDSLSAHLVFSALDADLARAAEPELARRGHAVVTNASAHRMAPRVPLVVPEVNAEHLGLLDAQADWPGSLVANPNCSTIGLVLALAPLADAFGLKRVDVVTLQALSGGGAPTADTLELLAEVAPYIPGEEEKLEEEPHKILGELIPDAPPWVEPALLDLRARCNRVPVQDGHTQCVSVVLAEDASEEAVRAAWRDFSGVPQELELPSAPPEVILIHEEPDAPRPRRDLCTGGMAIHVGRVRLRSPRELEFTTLSHNTLRGAAGGALLVAELMLATGRLGEGGA